MVMTIVAKHHLPGLTGGIYPGSSNTTPSNYLSHTWTSPNSPGAASLGAGAVSYYNPTAVGTFTYCVTNTNNGCSTCKTVTVTGSAGFPTPFISSSSQFTIGCGTSSLTAINIGGSTNPIGGGVVSYTVLPPGFSGNYNTGFQSLYNLIVPGTSIHLW